MWTEPASATASRILHALELTQRPLSLDELAGALALPRRESQRICLWLTREGYVMACEVEDESKRSAVPSAWSLAERGRLWARHCPELQVPQVSDFTAAP
jgi:hypothetical protein